MNGQKWALFGFLALTALWLVYEMRNAVSEEIDGEPFDNAPFTDETLPRSNDNDLG